MRALYALAMVLFACGEPDPEANARAERASIVVMRVAFELGEDGEPDRLVRYPACGGVALGPREVVTAAHCVPAEGGAVELVTREQWFTTADAFIPGVVVSVGPGDVATLEPDDALEHFTELAGHTPPDGLLVRRFRATRVELRGLSVRGVRLAEGDSGAGVFDANGALVGVLSGCYTDAAGECDARGGLLVQP